MWWLLLLLAVRGQELHLTTDDEGYLTVIQGFSTQLQCILNSCSSNVNWFKDDLLIFNGTGFVNASGDSSAYKLQHKIDVDYDKGCSGQCSDSEPCSPGFACVDNQCCSCAKEDFTLILKNLTFEDSGRYRCQLANQSELLEFHVEVLESGLKGGFHENIEYDYSACCQEKGISSTCRAMCKPSEMAEHHFDPTSCKTDDYKNFLTCATQNNTRNHVHCCKTQLVPSFCYDFCSADFQVLRRSHRLCLYYLPEIFECYNRAYLPFPDPPESLQVNAIDHDKLSVCWSPPLVHPNNKDYPVSSYTVSYKEIPNFPLFGGEMGIPLLTGDYSEITDLEDGDYEDSEAHTIKARSVEEEGAESEVAELKDKIEVRQKRANIIVVTRDPETNTSAVREFAFHHVNTTETCHTLSDLRAATRYVIIVTARNSFGSSVPSVRALASTNAQILPPSGKLPNSVECCKTNGVSDVCAKKMCKMETPSSLETISISTSCRSEWPKVAPCIADQRNHTECCRRKNVQSDCLQICEGSTEPLGVHSVLCLNLDLSTIYQCLREGYETHPSSPVNVSVHDVSETTVEIRWAEPATNAQLVQTYNLFIRKTEHGAPVRQVHNAVSPHTELGLDPDSEYSVQIVSISSQGASLPSTAIVFSTKAFNMPMSSCPMGEPLLLEDHRVFICSALNPCPSSFRCSEEGEEPVCCQIDGFNSDSDFQECCKAQGVSSTCMQHCFFNATHLPEECKGDLNRWVQCGSQGKDHSRCCEQESVPHDCLTGCRHPFQVPDSCLSETQSLMTCFAARSGKAPTAPKNVRVSLIRHNSVTISWEESDYDVNTFKVDLFFKNGTLMDSTNTTVDVLRLDKLQPLTTYSARVTGYNEVGVGPSSWNVTFTTLSENDTEGDRPRQPENVHIAWNTGARVNMTWDTVDQNRKGDAISADSYRLYYKEADTLPGSQLNVITRNTSWGVMPELRRDALYSVYVTALVGKKESRPSSVITLIAVPDTYDLPEPELVFEPEYGVGFFNAGDAIHINCTLGEVANKTRDFNIDLIVGPHSASNDHGKTWAALVVQADSTLDTARCAVTNTDGRQTVNMKHIRVKYGPVARMNSTTIRAFGAEAARIICTVEGYPTPTISFEKDGKSVTDKFAVSFRLLRGNIYQAILTIPRTRGNEGVYECVATTEGQTSRGKTELVIATEKHPQNPRHYLDCCEDEKIKGDCLQACTLGSVPATATNCTEQYGKSMLKCADNIRDHSDCCSATLIPKQCLPLCSGDVLTKGVDCTKFAIEILSCSVKGHSGSPSAVTGLMYELMDDDRNSIKVSWDEDKNLTQYQYYVVYYRRKGPDDDFKQSKSRFNSVTLPITLDNDEDYEVAVVAANAAGHSPLVFMDLTGRERTEKSSHTLLYVLLAMFIVCVIVVNLYVFGLRRQFPSPFGKLFGGGAVLNDATVAVAFENPAYVSGNEVEIRGLGRPEWQTAELVGGAEDDGYRNSSQSGMRYSKLESA